MNEAWHLACEREPGLDAAWQEVFAVCCLVLGLSLALWMLFDVFFGNGSGEAR